MIDKAKLPVLMREIIDDYLSPSLPRADYDYLVLVVLYSLSKIACFSRVVLDNDQIQASDTMPNFYMLSFSSSGSGKDRGMKVMDKIMDNFKTDCNKKFSRYYERKYQEIEEHITAKGWKAREANEYRKANAPRFLKMEIGSNSTLEGFIETRKAFYKAQMGCTCWEDSEIYDTIKIQDRNTKEFIRQNKEAFDDGKTDGKIIKGEKIAEDVSGVPHLMALHGAIDTEEAEDLFKSFFDLGFARRCFVFTGTKRESFQEITEDEKEAFNNRALKALPRATSLIDSFYNKLKPDGSITFPRGGKVFTFTKEAERLYGRYENDNARIAFGLENSNNLGIIKELEGRHWKALKLSALLCAQDSKDLVVTEQHFKAAMYITDYYGIHFKRFYLLEKDSLEKRFADYLIENGPVNKAKLTQAKFIQGSYPQRKAIMREVFDNGSLVDYLSLFDKTLLMEKTGKLKNTDTYSIIDIEEHQQIVDAQNYMVRYSQGMSNEEHETHFIDGANPFNKLHEIVQLPYKYSASRFSDEYRHGESWKADNNLIILDVDNEVTQDKQLTIEMVKQRLSAFSFLIMPTKNHLKDKKGKGIRERFRILLPTLPMDGVTKDKYQQVIGQLVKDFNLDYSQSKKTWVDLQAAKDVARVYAGFNSKPIYNFGKLLNWKVFLYELATKKQSKYADVNIGPNCLDKNVTIDIKGRPCSIETCVMEAKMANKSVPCKAFCHEDKTPSAHIRINESGNLQYSCSTCGITKYWNL